MLRVGGVHLRFTFLMAGVKKHFAENVNGLRGGGKGKGWPLVATSLEEKEKKKDVCRTFSASLTSHHSTCSDRFINTYLKLTVIIAITATIRDDCLEWFSLADHQGFVGVAGIVNWFLSQLFLNQLR